MTPRDHRDIDDDTDKYTRAYRRVSRGQALMLPLIATLLQVSGPSFVRKLGILASCEIPSRIGGRQERSTLRNEIKLNGQWQSL